MICIKLCNIQSITYKIKQALYMYVYTHTSRTNWDSLFLKKKDIVIIFKFK